MTTYKPKPTFKFTPVKIIILCILFLNVISLTSLYSSLHQGGQLVGADIFYKQLTWIAFGWIIFILFCFINYRFYYDLSFIFYGINIFLLLLVYILGTTAMGAQRWISIFGFNFQPSEISKVAILFILARFFSNKEQQGTLREVLIPFALVAFNALLIIKQPDLGTGLILFFLFFIMGFYSRLPKRYFVILMMIGLMLLPVGWKILKDYQKKRLIVFMNPDVDPLGAGYTIIQSKIAIGSGKVAGKGFLSGTQNQFNFLPERHTDFIFTVVA